MAASTALRCSVITPESQIFDGAADFVVIPAHDGEIGILPNRAPLLARLGAGQMRLQATGGGEESWFIDGGFAQVLNNRVIVLTQKAIRPEKLSRAKAAEQLDAARSMPGGDDVAARRKAALEASARAQLRLAAAD